MAGAPLLRPANCSFPALGSALVQAADMNLSLGFSHRPFAYVIGAAALLSRPAWLTKRAEPSRARASRALARTRPGRNGFPAGLMMPAESLPALMSPKARAANKRRPASVAPIKFQLGAESAWGRPIDRAGQT